MKLEFSEGLHETESELLLGDGGKMHEAESDIQEEPHEIKSEILEITHEAKSGFFLDGGDGGGFGGDGGEDSSGGSASGCWV